MLGENAREHYLERGRALLEVSHSKEIQRSAEETERLKQHGRLLLNERIYKQETCYMNMEETHQSDAPLITGGCQERKNEAKIDAVGGPSDSLLLPTELVVEVQDDKNNMFNSNHNATTMTNSTLFDFVREQHVQDVHQHESLCSKCILLQETIDCQQEQLNKLADRLAQREAQIECLTKEGKCLAKSAEAVATQLGSISELNHGAMNKNFVELEKYNHINEQLEQTTTALRHTEGILAHKEEEIRELLLQLHQEKEKGFVFEENNKILFDSNLALKRELDVLMKEVKTLREELSESKKVRNNGLDGLQQLQQQLSDLQSAHIVNDESTPGDEVDCLSMRCADAERGREAAEAALRLLETDLEGQRRHVLELEMTIPVERPRTAALPSKNPFASMGGLSGDPKPLPAVDDDDVFGASAQGSSPIVAHAVSAEPLKASETLVKELEGRVAELETQLIHATTELEGATKEVDCLSMRCADAERGREAAEAALRLLETDLEGQRRRVLELEMTIPVERPRTAALPSKNPFASMGGLSGDPKPLPAVDDDDVFGASAQGSSPIVAHAVSAEPLKASETLVKELEGRVAELETQLIHATTELEGATKEVDCLSMRCADAERGREAAEAALRLLETDLEGQRRRVLELEMTIPVERPRTAALPSKNPFASMGGLSGDPKPLPAVDDDDVFGASAQGSSPIVAHAVSAEPLKASETLVKELEGRVAELETQLIHATTELEGATKEVDCLSMRCADAERGREAAEAALRLLETDLEGQRRRVLELEMTIPVERPRTAALPSKNPFASMGGLSGDPKPLPAVDDDDVFGASAQGSSPIVAHAVSAEPLKASETLVKELEGRVAELETQLIHATTELEGATKEVDCLSMRCADAERGREAAEAALRLLETDLEGQRRRVLELEMTIPVERPRTAALPSKNPFASMGGLSGDPKPLPAVDDDDVFGASAQGSSPIVAHAVSAEPLKASETLVKELEGRVAELETQLIHATTELEGATKEVDCLSMRCADAERGREAAEAALRLLETDLEGQRRRVLELEMTIPVERPRTAALPSKNPFASMGGLSGDPKPLPAVDDDDVFGASAQGSSPIVAHAVSAEPLKASETLVKELEGRVAELETQLIHATTELEGATKEVDCLSMRCADAERGREAAEAALRLLETDLEGQRRRVLELEMTIPVERPRTAALPSKNPFASMGGLSGDPKPLPAVDDDDVFGASAQGSSPIVAHAVSAEPLKASETLVKELEGRVAELETQLIHATTELEGATKEVDCLSMRCADAERGREAAEAALRLLETDLEGQRRRVLELEMTIPVERPRTAALPSKNPFASMGGLSGDPKPLPAVDDDDVFGASAQGSSPIVAHAVSAEPLKASETLVKELEGRVAELETQLIHATTELEGATKEVDCLSMRCADAERGREAAEAALRLLETDLEGQRRRVLELEMTIPVERPRTAALPSKNPFASMGGLSGDPKPLPAVDDDDVFGASAQGSSPIVAHAVSAEPLKASETLVKELEGRVAELETQLIHATTELEGATKEVDCLSMRCADAERGREAAEAALRLLETDLEGQRRRVLELEMTIPVERPRTAALPSKNPFASMGGLSGDPKPLPAVDDDDVFGASAQGSSPIVAHAVSAEPLKASETLVKELEGRVAELETQLIHATTELEGATKEVDCLSMRCADAERGREAAEAALRLLETDLEGQRRRVLELEMTIPVERPRTAALPSKNPFASMGGLSGDPNPLPAVDDDDVFGASAQGSSPIVAHAVSAEPLKASETLVKELEGRVAELETQLIHATTELEGAKNGFRNVTCGIENVQYLFVKNLDEENARLKEELNRIKEEHRQELEEIAREASDRIAEHDELLQQKLEEQEADFETRLVEELEACKIMHSDSDSTLLCVKSLDEENARLKEELDRLKEELSRITEEHRQELEEIAREASDRIAEHDELLQQKLEEKEADFETRLVEELEACKIMHSDSDSTLLCVKSLDEENARLKEELDRLKEELSRITEEHRQELEEIAREASDRIAEHDELLQQKLEEQEADFETRLVEELEACKIMHSDSDSTLLCVKSLDEENARLKEELDRLKEELSRITEEHRQELEEIAREASDRIAEHDELLQQKLEEQEEYYEGILRERPPLNSPSAMTSDLAGVAYWKEEHDKVYERFEQLQSELGSYLHGSVNRHEGLNEVGVNMALQEDSGAQDTCLVDDLQTAPDTVAEEIKFLRGQLLQLQQSKDHEEEERITQHAKEIHELREQLEGKERSICELTKVYEETTSLLRDGAASVETVLQEKRVRIEELEGHVENFSKQLTSAHNELRVVRAELQQKQKEFEESEQRHLELGTAHGQLAAELLETKCAFEKQRRSWAERLGCMHSDKEEQQSNLPEETHQERCGHQLEADGPLAELQVFSSITSTPPPTIHGNHHQLEHLSQQLTEALNEKIRLEAELEVMHRKLKQNESLLHGEQDGNDSACLADGNLFLSDARISLLVKRNEVLETKVHQLSGGKDALLQEKDVLELALQNATRMAEVRDCACERQTEEVERARTQIAAMKDDLSLRVNSCNALRLELYEERQHAADVERVYEASRATTSAERCNVLLREHMGDLLMAKMMTVPCVAQDIIQSYLQAYQGLLLRFADNQRNLLARCDVIERAATEAMIEGERQGHEYLAVVEDAKIEQHKLREIIQRLERELLLAHAATKEATGEAAAIKTAFEEALCTSREEAVATKRDLQALRIEHAFSLDNISLLQAENANFTQLLEQAKATVAEQQLEIAGLREALLEKARVLRGTHEGVEQKLVDAVVRADECEVQLGDAAKQAHVAQGLLDRVLPRFRQLEEEQASREEELLDTRQQLEALSQRNAAMEVMAQEQANALTKTVCELRTAHTTLNKKCNTLCADVERLKIQLVASEAEVERFRARTAHQEQEAQVAYTRLSELESAYARDTLNAQTGQREAERHCEVLEQRNGALQQELQTSREQNEALRESYAEMDERLRRLTNEYRDNDEHQRRHIQQLTERCEELEGKLCQLRETHIRFTMERDALKRELLNTKQEAECVGCHLEDTNRHNEQLHVELRRQKESHEAELLAVRETLEAAKAELTQCRHTLAGVETRETAMRHTTYAVEQEKALYVEELDTLPRQSQEEQHHIVQERSEKRGRVVQLEAELEHLNNALYIAQQECRVLEMRCKQQKDDADLLRCQLEDMTERYQGLQQKAAIQQEQLVATVKALRAEGATLQIQLDDVAENLRQKQRECEQCEERMLRRVELSRFSEETFRQENALLQSDLEQLQQKLTTAVHTAKSAENTMARQQMTIHALTEELERYKKQAVDDFQEQSQLRSAVQEKTLQLDRVARETTVELEEAIARAGEEHLLSSDKLEVVVQRERQAAHEARTARESALESLEQRRAECKALQAEVGQLQKTLRTVEAQAVSMRTEVRNIVAQAAEEVGIGERDELSLGDVFSQLLLRLSHYTHATIVLDAELSQFRSFEQACEAHAEALRLLRDVKGQSQLAAGVSAPTSPPFAPSDGSICGSISSSQQQSILEHTSAIQDVIASASTYAHCLMEHSHMLQCILDSMETALARGDTNSTIDPAVAKMKLNVLLTLGELHLRTARQTRLLRQIADGSVMSPAFQDAVKTLREDENCILRPFNELCMFSLSTQMSASRRHKGDGDNDDDALFLLTLGTAMDDDVFEGQCHERDVTTEQKEQLLPTEQDAE